MSRMVVCSLGHDWESADGDEARACPICAMIGSLADCDDSTIATEEVDELPPPPNLSFSVSGAWRTRSAEFRSPPEPAAPQIPGYEMLEQLGRGGMGVVYKARHLKLNRPVALKMLLGGGHSGALERDRFRREAEAVASLQHPNIVQIFEIGEYDGLLFLALELVEGGSLSQKLAGAPLHPRPAAELVEILARAIHHAHERGIVHRDLKPANVLLSGIGCRAESGIGYRVSGIEKADAEPAVTSSRYPTPDTRYPKVTDFGLAKRLDDPSGPTQSGMIMGTPSYMAPEQAEGQTAQIGPPADIYALGALLYECLIGRPPFKAASVVETIQQVIKNDPVAPRRLQPGIPRDLETICLKCLNKEPAKRYATAGALADDLRCLLDGRPIAARRTPLLERAAKWTRRRPTAAALIGFVLIAGTAAAAFAIKYFDDLRRHNEELTTEKNKVEAESKKAKAALTEREKERQRAEDNLERAVEAIERMLKRVAVHHLDRMPLMDRQQVQLLEDALALFDRLIASQEDDSRLRIMQAHTLQQSAVILLKLGRYPEAHARIDRGLELIDRLRRQETEESPDPARMRLEAWLHAGRAMIFFRGNDLAKARDEVETALVLQEKLRASEPGNSEYRADVAASRSDLAAFYLAEGNLDKAELHLVRGREETERLIKAEPREAHYLTLHAHILNNLGASIIDRGEFVRAAAILEKSISAWRRLRQADPGSIEYAAGLARGLNNHGAALFAQGYLKKSDALFQEAFALRERLVRDHPASRPLTADLAWSIIYRGRVHAEREEHDQATTQFNDAIALIEKVDATDATFREALREAYTARGEVASSREDSVSAERDFAKAVALATGPRQRELMVLHAILLAGIGQPEKAAAQVDAALDGHVLPPRQIFDAARALAVAAAKESDAGRAEQAAARAVKLLASLVPTGYFHTTERQAMLDKHPALASLRKRADFKALRDKLK